jgi:hypothetical protein
MKRAQNDTVSLLLQKLQLTVRLLRRLIVGPEIAGTIGLIDWPRTTTVLMEIESKPVRYSGINSGMR